MDQTFGTRQALICCGLTLVISSVLAGVFPATRAITTSVIVEEPALV